MTAIKFTNKTEYLAWRTLWRAEYADLVSRIREHKKARKSKEYVERSMAQCRCALLRKDACEMLQQRKQSKVLAGQQYAAAKAAKAAQAQAA